MSDTQRRGLPWRAFVVGVLLALAIGYALRPTGENGAPPVAQESSGAPTAIADPGDSLQSPEGMAESAVSGPVQTASASPSQAKPLAPFATLDLSRASFPASGSVVVTLDLGAPQTDDSPRLVRMFSATDQRGILTDARLDASRSIATLQLDPSFLLPGEYFVEVTTTERSAFPVRRYVIVVR